VPAEAARGEGLRRPRSALIAMCACFYAGAIAVGCGLIAYNTVRLIETLSCPS
jgi:hypothetical protein